VQPRGDKLALRFDTSLRCGRTSYDTVGRAVVPFDGRGFSGGASRRMRIPGGRIDYAWTIAGQADAIHELTYDANGVLRSFRADFEQHCEGATPALRGTWVFKAA
jgi:hypothetical protein